MRVLCDWICSAYEISGPNRFFGRHNTLLLFIPFKLSFRLPLHYPYHLLHIVYISWQVAATVHFAHLAPLEAILFDVDGTLSDSDPFHYLAFYEMLQEVGFNGGVPITKEFYAENLSGKHNDDLHVILFPDWDVQRARKFLEDKEAMFRRLASEKLEPLKGLPKLRKWIEDHGLKHAAVTNAPRENGEFMISNLGLRDFFQVFVIGNECDRPKPFPDPYLKALQVLNISPKHAFVFEDSVSGIKAGVAAGMLVVGLTTGNPEKTLLEAGAAFVINDFDDPKLWKALEELDKKA